jgi:hypothetical protein
MSCSNREQAATGRGTLGGVLACHAQMCCKLRAMTV